jgi:L-serine kinase (ATP) / ParB family transcriptional regulator, heme-responsive regulator
MSKLKIEYNNIKIGELPDIRLVPVDELFFHEDPDEERLLALVSRLGAEGVLKNPPIVAETDSAYRYIILDGANRVTALIKHNFTHIPVQVVNLKDPRLTVECWHHAVEKYDKEYFLREISRLAGVELIPTETVRQNGDDDVNGNGWNNDDILCQFVFADGTGFRAKGDGDIFARVDKLKMITDLYIHTPLYDRVSYTNLTHLKSNYPEFMALLTFRAFSKEELLQIVLSGRKLPAGVTRVLLPKRALGLNIRLEFLRSSLTLEEKNHWLVELIHKMVLSKTIRFYQEPTFVFDE